MQVWRCEGVVLERYCICVESIEIEKRRRVLVVESYGSRQMSSCLSCTESIPASLTERWCCIEIGTHDFRKLCI